MTMNARVYVHNPYTAGTGNYETISRISRYFGKQYCSNDCDIFVVLHARRSYEYVVAHPTRPYVLIVGGTDLNEDVYDSSLRWQVDYVLSQASCVVVFMEYQRRQVLKTLPRAWVSVVPQGLEVTIPEKPRENIVEVLRGMKYYVWVGNRRSVKDPMYLQNEFEYMWKTYRVYLVYIGSGHERRDWNIVLGKLTRAEVFWVTMRSSGLINTSFSEGMCGAVMEAMELGVPVICRCNSFSEELLEDRVTGHIFSTPSQFLQQVFFRDLRETVEAARKRVRELCDWRNEYSAYKGICDCLV